MASERVIRLNRLVLWLLPIVFAGAVGAAALSALRANQAESQLDARLQQIVAIYNLRPLEIREYSADPEMRLGQALFFDPIISGDRDVSCSSCHLLSYGLTDGLPRSIGVGGVGFGPGRHLLHGLSIHPRRSLDLWNRDNNAVSSFFWTGMSRFSTREGGSSEARWARHCHRDFKMRWPCSLLCR